MIYILIVTHIITPILGPKSVNQSIAAYKSAEQCYKAASRVVGADKTQCLELEIR